MDRVYVVGRMTEESLEGSYARAFRHLGLEVSSWDMPSAIRRFTRAGRVGAYFNEFWPSEPWIAKANGELLVSIIEARPRMVAVFGTSRMLAGTLAQIKTALPRCQLVLIWPDTMLNCHSLTLAAIPIFDLIATYSQSSIDVFKRLGARRADWVPLAFDPELHPPCPPPDPKFAGDYEVSFVGNYSRERERVILELLRSGIRVGVWGGRDSWQSAEDKQSIKRYFKGGPIYGSDLPAAVRAAPVSINPIALSNFPAANMRFFEIPGSGGVPVSAPCPEMEPQFPDKEACFYYSGISDVARIVRSALDDQKSRERVAAAGHDRTVAAHTYVHRAQQIVNALL